VKGYLLVADVLEFDADPSARTHICWQKELFGRSFDLLISTGCTLSEHWDHLCDGAVVGLVVGEIA
jgi:hypothetical protein